MDDLARKYLERWLGIPYMVISVFITLAGM